MDRYRGILKWTIFVLSCIIFIIFFFNNTRGFESVFWIINLLVLITGYSFRIPNYGLFYVLLLVAFFISYYMLFPYSGIAVNSIEEIIINNSWLIYLNIYVVSFIVIIEILLSGQNKSDKLENNLFEERSKDLSNIKYFISSQVQTPV